MTNERGARVGVVCRWKPVHVVHAAMLEALCARAAAERGGVLLVGIGSSNRYDRENPFTAAETAEMIRACLRPRGYEEGYDWELLLVPDLGHGPRWRAMVRRLFGPLDLFVTANAYVASLLRDVYPLAHPRDLVPPDRHAPVSGTTVRRALARGEPWEHLVPPEVAAFMRARGLPARFRREFGLATLAAANAHTTIDEERAHVLLG